MEILFILATGLIFGSFITCASWRLPRGQDVVKKPSYCPCCNTKLGFRDLWPVLSWAAAGGKCRHCKARVHWRYPATELVTAAIFFLLYDRFGMTSQSIVLTLLAVALLVMIVVDFEHYIIPDEIHYFLLPLGVFYHWIMKTDMGDVAAGVIVGLIIGPGLHYGYRWLRKKEGLGFGDVKFMVVAGLWLGLTSMPAFLFFSGAMGVALGLFWRAMGRGPRFPFGPALALAMFMCLVYPETVAWFWSFFSVTDALSQLESDSIYILREAVRAVPKLAMLWSFGKDSNVMVHLARKAFFGRVPFALVHCDTGLEMPEVYAFRDRYVTEWRVELIAHPCPPLEKTDASLPPAARVAARKTLGLKEVMQRYGFTGIIAGIRRDEEATRAKERVFSLRGDDGQWDVREQPPEFFGQYNTVPPLGGSLRIHPLLNWSERDIWRYTEREDIPLVPLYFAKSYGLFEGRDFGGKIMRFRSIGERGITWPVESNAATISEIITELQSVKTSERAGRPMGADEDESSFERLRQSGYM